MQINIAVVLKNGTEWGYEDIQSIKSTDKGFVEICFEDAQGRMVMEAINKDIVSYYKQVTIY